MSKARAIKTGTMAAMMVLALPFTAQHEGLRLKAYLDPVSIPTICYGETEGVAMGMVASKTECDHMLEVKLGMVALQVDQLVVVPMGPEMHAALASFAYNVGIGAFKGSTLLRLLNAGDKVGACNQLPRWVFARGKWLPGLAVRREEERQLCLKGVR